MTPMQNINVQSPSTIIKLQSFISRHQAVWIPIFFGLTLLTLSPIHDIFNEWGGVMQYFAGKEIFSGAGYHGWTAGFWPPLFSILVGLGSLLFPGFLAGKLITILASSVLLFVTYHLAIVLSHRNDVGLWSQVFLALSPVYFYQSLRAHNHMIDALFFTLGLFLFIRSTKSLTWSSFLVSGIACGLAGLARYTSYILIFLPLFLFFFKLDYKKVFKYGLMFWTGFAIVSLPWWYYNTINNGSPIYTWEYLNLCTAIVPGNSYGTFASLWSCRNQIGLNSFYSIISTYPIEYLKNFARNIFASGKMVVSYGGVLAPFVIPAFFDSLFHINLKRWILIFGELVLLICIVSQASVLDWYLLGSMIIIVIISTMFLFNYSARISDRYPFITRFKLFNFSLIFLTLIGLALAFVQLNVYRNERSSGFTDLNQISQLIKEKDPNIKSKVVMATDPAWAYYLGAKYLSTPAVYDGTVEGLVSYQGISNDLKAYAPKYPSAMPISELRADYLIYRKSTDVWTNESDLPQYSFLFDPRSNEIPANFKLLYNSPNTVVYEITWK
jgi:4-amino-4-deoxy-L-arabinose transferase-like glycosyltransferase